MTYKELIEQLERLKDLGKDIDNAEVVYVSYTKHRDKQINQVKLSKRHNNRVIEIKY